MPVDATGGAGRSRGEARDSQIRRTPTCRAPGRRRGRGPASAPRAVGAPRLQWWWSRWWWSWRPLAGRRAGSTPGSEVLTAEPGSSPGQSPSQLLLVHSRPARNAGVAGELIELLAGLVRQIDDLPSRP